MSRPKSISCEDCRAAVKVKATGRLPKRCPDCRANRRRRRNLRRPERPWEWSESKPKPTITPGPSEPLVLDPDRSFALRPLISGNDRSPRFHHRLVKWKKVAGVLLFGAAVLAGLSLPYLFLG